MLDNTSPTTVAIPPHTFRGRYLSSNKLPPIARAWVAVQILEGRATLTQLTAQQVAGLCRVSVSSVQTVRNAGNGHSPKPANLVLEKAWRKATPAERLAFVQNIGTEPLWNTLTAAL